MAKIQLSARFAIHPGKLDQFLAVARECLACVKQKDKGTLQYDWFVDSDGTECVVRETYRDSAAVLEHVGNLGDLFGRLVAVSEFSLEIYGAATPELLEVARAFEHRTYRFVLGL